MAQMEHVKIEGRFGTWYEIDRNEDYILFESEQYGDEAGMILTNHDLEEITETWDNLEDTVDSLYYQAGEALERCLEMGFDPFEGCYTNDC